ncbi:MAG: cupin domain-containing protein [Candidatus Geothermincolia bacterium]
MKTAQELGVSVKNFQDPDGVREFPKMRLTHVDVGPYRVAKTECEPGWIWSVHAKPIVKTESCEVTHLIYQVSGRHHVKMNDGTEIEYGPGEMVFIPPGHDGWTAGDEPSVFIDTGPLEEGELKPAAGHPLSVKSFEDPDGVREFPKTRLDHVDLGGYRVARTELEPGWKWSENLKLLMGTDSCQVVHLIYQLSGRQHLKMDGGPEFDVGPGDVGFVPAGHDCWVLGDEPSIFIDIGPLEV